MKLVIVSGEVRRVVFVFVGFRAVFFRGYRGGFVVVFGFGILGRN